MVNPKSQPEFDEALRALQLLVVSGGIVEVRVLDACTAAVPQPHVESGYFQDLRRAAEAAVGFRNARGIYITLNEISPTLLARANHWLRSKEIKGAATSDADVIHRHWLPIDCDPVRPRGVSASEGEHNLALQRARAIREVLSVEGWPEPIYADSGNGAHLLYRIGLPAADGGLVEQVLAALAFRLSDAFVKIDQTVSSAAQIWKLYGTIARKGQDTPDRPHRLARLLEVPEHLIAVSEENLRSLAAALPSDTAPGPGAQHQSGKPFDLERWICEHGLDVEMPEEWRGGRRWIFPVCPWNSDHRNRSAYLLQFPSGAIAAGCHHNGCAGKDWHSLRDLFEPGWSTCSNHRDCNSTRQPFRRGTQPCTAADIISRLENLLPTEGKPDRWQVEEMATDLITECVDLTSAELMRVAAVLHKLGMPNEFTRQWQGAVREERSNAKVDEIGDGNGTEPSDQPDSWPYLADQGRLWLLSEVVRVNHIPRIDRQPIADFTAMITEEAIGEDGGKYWTVEGVTVEGKAFRAGISVADFADDRALQARLTEAAGPRAPVFAKMTPHLRPAIQKCTNGSLRQVRRYERTGWNETGHFLISGREQSDTTINLPRKLPYLIAPDGDLTEGVKALEGLIGAMRPECTTVVLAAILEAPLARPVGWHNERYATFISGRSGSLKTSWTQAAMCIWGDFLRDELLIRWGEGATRNAIMALATHASDMPFLIDNYKPSTGGGTRDFTNLVHAIVEGSEKDRLSRAAELCESKPVLCWPIFTGEDVPADDSASLARVLVVPFAWERGHTNDRLTQAQANARHLSAVGNAWLAWLENKESRVLVAQAANRFPETRASVVAERVIGVLPCSHGKSTDLRSRDDQ